jgi:hypothetical protein
LLKAVHPHHHHHLPRRHYDDWGGPCARLVAKPLRDPTRSLEPARQLHHGRALIPDAACAAVRSQDEVRLCRSAKSGRSQVVPQREVRSKSGCAAVRSQDRPDSRALAYQYSTALYGARLKRGSVWGHGSRGRRCGYTEAFGRGPGHRWVWSAWRGQSRGEFSTPRAQLSDTQRPLPDLSQSITFRVRSVLARAALVRSGSGPPAHSRLAPHSELRPARRLDKWRRNPGVSRVRSRLAEGAQPSCGRCSRAVTVMRVTRLAALLAHLPTR